MHKLVENNCGHPESSRWQACEVCADDLRDRIEELREQVEQQRMEIRFNKDIQQRANEEHEQLLLEADEHSAELQADKVRLDWLNNDELGPRRNVMLDKIWLRRGLIGREAIDAARREE